MTDWAKSHVRYMPINAAEAYVHRGSVSVDDLAVLSLQKQRQVYDAVGDALVQNDDEVEARKCGAPKCAPCLRGEWLCKGDLVPCRDVPA